MSRFPNYCEPLFQCEGPKLHPFCDRESTIGFVRLLSNGGSEGHSHVFEVSIGSKAYALKMVRPQALINWIYH